jgi:hypothetical protein
MQNSPFAVKNLLPEYPVCFLHVAPVDGLLFDRSGECGGASLALPCGGGIWESGVLQLAALIMSYFEVAESRHALNGPDRRSRSGDC